MKKKKKIDKTLFFENLSKTLNDLGKITSKILNDMDQADKDLNQKIKKATKI